MVGHSHSTFHKFIENTHFINPGSVGRMFDGNNQASYATLEIVNDIISVNHHRVSYNVEMVIDEIKRQKLPEIYCEMYRTGKKLN